MFNICLYVQLCCQKMNPKAFLFMVQLLEAKPRVNREDKYPFKYKTTDLYDQVK